LRSFLERKATEEMDELIYVERRNIDETQKEGLGCADKENSTMEV